MGAKRQPDKFRHRKSTLELILRLAVSHEARIETLEGRDKPDLRQGRPPGVEDVIGTARAQIQVRGKVNWPGRGGRSTGSKRARRSL